MCIRDRVSNLWKQERAGSQSGPGNPNSTARRAPQELCREILASSGSGETVSWQSSDESRLLLGAGFPDEGGNEISD